MLLTVCVSRGASAILYFYEPFLEAFDPDLTKSLGLLYTPREVVKYQVQTVDRGRRTAAVLRSFVASCQLVEVDPFAWFQDVLSRIAAHPITSLEELLPHRWVQARA